MTSPWLRAFSPNAQGSKVWVSRRLVLCQLSELDQVYAKKGGTGKKRSCLTRSFAPQLWLRKAFLSIDNHIACLGRRERGSGAKAHSAEADTSRSSCWWNLQNTEARKNMARRVRAVAHEYGESYCRAACLRASAWMGGAPACRGSS